MTIKLRVNTTVADDKFSNLCGLINEALQFHVDHKQNCTFFDSPRQGRNCDTCNLKHLVIRLHDSTSSLFDSMGYPLCLKSNSLSPM